MVKRVDFQICGALSLILRIACDKSGLPYTMINRVQTQCEAEALIVGTALADAFNSYDEDTEWDMRIHNEFLTEHLGFAVWEAGGTWGSGGRTPLKLKSDDLMHQGGWKGIKTLNESAYWALENKWLYLMGDSTMRQIWAAFLSPIQSHEFEVNAKEWTRENCARQFPHRKAHPPGDYPEEGWSGKCGNNEVTCDLSGFGSQGKITFDWKHFPYEDYDEWLFGEDGRWGKPELKRPDVLAVQIGLHTCFHAYRGEGQPFNEELVLKHTGDLPMMMQAIRTAVDRPNNENITTKVIIVTGPRTGSTLPHLDECTWRFNRMAALEAHRHGFAVFEREELERRILFRSEKAQTKALKLQLHLDPPAPNIVATSLLAMVGCLDRNDYSAVPQHQLFGIFKKKVP